MIVATSPADTVLSSPPSPAARFIAGASVAAACSAVRPALAKFRAAVAASFIPKVEFDAASFMASLMSFACFSVFPMVEFTSCIVLSTSANLLTAAVPAATSGSVTAAVSPVPMLLILEPTASIFVPSSFIFSPAATICCLNTEPNSFDSFSSSFRAAVSRSICVFRSRASCDVSSNPGAFFNFSRACFSISIFSFVFSISLESSCCLSFKRSTFPGSSLRALLISRRLFCVFFKALSTLERALVSPVLSPFSSMVMPLILPDAAIVFS